MKSVLISIALITIYLSGYSQNNALLKYPFSLPTLKYTYNALEPYIDKETMDIHYNKHHAAYVNNLNAAIKGTDMENKSLSELFTKMSKYPAAVRNNGGGVYNHNLFWEILINPGDTIIPDILKKAIEKDLGGMAKFKTDFENAAKSRFGSGWAWLSVDSKGALFVSSTPNQDNPLMDVADKKGIPILGLDVWEHAYYLKYQNKRPDYISAFWKIINWKKVEENYIEAIKK